MTDSKVFSVIKFRDILVSKLLYRNSIYKVRTTGVFNPIDVFQSILNKGVSDFDLVDGDKIHMILSTNEFAMPMPTKFLTV